jgi:hypothetical protein
MVSRLSDKYILSFSPFTNNKSENQSFGKISRKRNREVAKHSKNNLKFNNFHVLFYPTFGLRGYCTDNCNNNTDKSNNNDNNNNSNLNEIDDIQIENTAPLA